MVAVKGIRVELGEADRVEASQRVAIRRRRYPVEFGRGGEEAHRSGAEGEIAIAAWLQHHRVPFTLGDALSANIHITRAGGGPPWRIDVRTWTRKPGQDTTAGAAIVDEALARLDGDYDGVILCSRTPQRTTMEPTVYGVEQLITRDGRTPGPQVVDALMRLHRLPIVVPTVVRRRPVDSP